MFEDKSIGLVLSGGGVRGMAHIGLIKAMREHHIEAKVVAGTSIGALVGALYANGHAVEDMLKFFKETPLFQYSFLPLLNLVLLIRNDTLIFLRNFFLTILLRVWTNHCMWWPPIY